MPQSMVNVDTILGMGVGAATVWFLWNKLDDWMSGDEKLPAVRDDRKFSPDSLEMYNGKEGRLCFVALQDGTVFDVSESKEALAKFGGRQLTEKEERDVGADKVRRSGRKVGSLVLPRNFTKEELAQFNSKNGRPVYIAAKGVIYDVDPEFYGEGGPYEMMAGKDASRALALVSLDPADVENTSLEGLTWMDLNTLDEWIAKFEMKYTRVGYLIDEKTGKAPAAPVPPAPSFLTKERQQIELAEKIVLSHDSFILRLRLPEENMILGLPVGKHIKFWCPNPKPVKDGEWNGQPDAESGKKEIERKYTPSSSNDDVGFVEVVIKAYKGGHERFPDGGKMSQYLDSLAVGDKLDVAGPFGRIEYLGKGKLKVGKKEKQVKMIGMMAGGTGITPMLQIIQAILKDPEDETKLSLIFGNQTEEDILVRDLLEAEAKRHPERFRLWYTLDRPPAEWDYSTGFIDEKMIKRHMPPPSDDSVILMCGPPPMIKFACKQNLEKLGYAKDAQIEF
ncbi:NADH-cytochrome b5 reductase 2 [Hondaea fermentalgiana]|uniref:NADH-cytochrome b5 reductase 2 n=1 Tax=Hondaea fermentalgiana TaxID=2315210 RepID=A0A2R5G7H8_9STRA|nr:NADH-cytochrome b5 reductase 2 [Hondaea fermentalgiana]|eukprot:GBG27006.1 NADH-cytochrome b5 reductase 2 [Hondaea fermentalgiana]